MIEAIQTNEIIQTEQMADGLWRLMSPLGEVAYLVEGSARAALVDAMGGLGNLPAVIASLIGEKPLDVLLTHRHEDHVGGAYWFDQVWIAEAEANCWDMCEKCAPIVAEQLPKFNIAPDAPYAIRDGKRPEVRFIAEGDVFDLGGRTLEAVALPGHTLGSMGFMCPELKCLFSGDAVTPIMCLCFDESLGLKEWQQTLAKIGQLPIEAFYTGHHAHAFTKADLASFNEAAQFSKTDRGYAWYHGYIPGWEGTIHFCPCPTADVDSVDFRATITKGLPPKRVSKKRVKHD